MAEINKHEERAHALLSASGSARWMGCTPSARLEEQFGGPDKTTSYAAEGTVAHELAELYLRHDVTNELDDEKFNVALEQLMDNEYFNDEMFDMVPIYVDYVEEQFDAAKVITPDALLLIEEKIDLSAYVPESFGSTDSMIISDKNLEVIDLKYGKGIPVSATANKQEMLYALGAYLKYCLSYDIETVSLTIVQPRLNNISSWNLTVEELLDWAEHEVKPKALLAFKGEGELVSGEWCKFCKVKGRCRTLAEDCKALTHGMKQPNLLTDEEVSEVLEKGAKIVDWYESVVAYATEMSESEGKNWPGFKLVAGRSVRKYVNEDDVVARLNSNNYGSDEIYTMKLKGLTEMQKVLGGKANFEKVLGDLIIKPQGKPVLVPLSDKRPALGAEEAIADFSD